MRRSSLLKFLIPNLNDAPLLDFIRTAFLNLLNCTFVNYNLFYYTQPFINSEN